jgi:ATP-binding protein involved in chromosome partitioning
MSGKGGVGKSFVTSGLAAALARAGRAVGVLDADFDGPTVARLLGADGPLVVGAEAASPLVGTDGVRCVSMAHLVEDGQPLAFRGPEAEGFVWRGAMEAAVLREFLSDVAWGPLDWLLVDLPPGIERFAALCDLLPAPPEVLTVTIPSPESRDVVRRALRAAADRSAPLLGIVENMVGPIFPGDAGGTLAREFGIPLLARVPFGPSGDVWENLAQVIGSP